MARFAARLSRAGPQSLLLLTWILTVMGQSLGQTTGSQALTPTTPEMPAQVKRLGILPPLHDEQTTAILQRLSDDRFIFESVNISLPEDDTLMSYNKALTELRSAHIAALVGPYHSQFSVACRHLRLSYLVTSQLPRGVEPDPFLNELFPSADVFAKSVRDIMSFYRYTKVAVVYDTWAGAVVLEQLLLQPAMEVTAFRVQQSDLQQVRGALKALREKYFEVYLTVLSPGLTSYLMDQALTLSMFSPKYKWILVNTHLDEFGLDRYVDTRANITVLRLMMDFNSEKCMLGSREISLKRAVLQDAVQVYKLQTANRLGMVDLAGCTGHLNFTKMGRRVESFLQIMSLQGYRKGEVTDEEIQLILGAVKLRKAKGQTRERETLRRQLSGTWRSLPVELLKRVVPSKSYSYVTREQVFGDEPLRITTKLEPPFVQYREDTRGWREPGIVEATTKRELEGMCLDILKEMSLLLGFTFNVSFVPDGKFGSLKPPPVGWTGMIRQLLDNKADIALAPFQMSADRSVAVDFTKPFMTKGTTVVVRRPEQHVWVFQFLTPLSKVVWSAIFLAFAIVSLVLFGVSRVNSDRQAQYTSNLRESFWYIWGTLLRGSLTGSPYAISSRIVSSAWWFFCLIVTSIYTANLAAFLTITIGDAGIESAADLASQDYYDYGTVDGSQTEMFFNHTRMPSYARMWAYMSVLSPGSRVRRVEDGFQRAREGKYAFIWDTPTIRHEISNDCNLMEVGSSFDNKGYGFAHQKHAAYAERLSWALLKLNDAGVLYRLERKWWRPQFCPDQRQSAKTMSLDLETVSGMYLVILAGIVISALLCLAQYSLSRSRRKKRRPKEEEQETPRPSEQCLKVKGDAAKGPSEDLEVFSTTRRSPFAHCRRPSGPSFAADCFASRPSS